MIVGRVFTVDDQIKAMLDAMAKMYNHQNCLPKSKPGKMMAIFVANPQASTLLALFQYEAEPIVLIAVTMFTNILFISLNFVRTAGFEPAAPCSQSRCAAKLRHVRLVPFSFSALVFKIESQNYSLRHISINLTERHPTVCFCSALN